MSCGVHSLRGIASKMSHIRQAITCFGSLLSPVGTGSGLRGPRPAPAGTQRAREALRRVSGLRGCGGPVGTVAEIRINAVSGPLGDVPLFEKMLSINGLGDILAVESGYEEGCKWGARLSGRTFGGRTIFKNKGAMLSNFV